MVEKDGRSVDETERVRQNVAERFPDRDIRGVGLRCISQRWVATTASSNTSSCTVLTSVRKTAAYVYLLFYTAPN